MSNPDFFEADKTELAWVRPDIAGTLIEGEGTTIVRWVIPPGRPKSPLHSHDDVEQFLIILRGAVEMTLGDDEIVVNEGDVVRIRKGVVHGGSRNLGDSDVIMLDVFCPARPEYVEAAKNNPIR